MHYEGAAKFCQKKKQAAKMESITEPISKTFIMVMGYFYSFSGFSDLSKICLRLPITQGIRL